MKVLICGDRNWGDPELVRKVVDAFPDGTTIVHGDARGADRHAHAAALRRGFRIRKYPAKWRQFGKGAGPIRNQQMLDDAKPELVIGFNKDIHKSRGTKDMLTRAIKAGIETQLYVGRDGNGKAKRGNFTGRRSG